jgi:hypothetical protein
MSSASPLHRILAAMADNPYWAAPSSTRPDPDATADRRPTRTEPAGTYNLTWLALQQDHARNVAEFVTRHGAPAPATDASLYAAAGMIAAADPAAAEDLAARNLAGRLLARIAIGEGRDAIAAITCPHCGCWSLTPIRTTTGGWQATCLRRHCATTTGARTWSLRAVAGHHLRDPWAA